MVFKNLCVLGSLHESRLSIERVNARFWQNPNVYCTSLIHLTKMSFLSVNSFEQEILCTMTVNRFLTRQACKHCYFLWKQYGTHFIAILMYVDSSGTQCDLDVFLKYRKSVYIKHVSARHASVFNIMRCLFAFQGHSQDLETGCPNLAIAKFLVVPFHFSRKIKISTDHNHNLPYVFPY